MYHGGELSDDFYVRGKVDFFFFCDKDLMSLLEVHNMVEELGYGNVFMSYHYRFPGMEIQNGLKPLMTNFYVINTCKFVPKHMMIDVYIKKIIPEECASQEIKFIKSFEPVTQTSVVIQEINGEEDDQKRLVQVNIGKGKLAIEYSVSGLGHNCSVPSQSVNQRVYFQSEPNPNLCYLKVEQMKEWLLINYKMALIHWGLVILMLMKLEMHRPMLKKLKMN